VYRADRASIVPYDQFEVGDDSAAAHAYLPPLEATCAPLSGAFEDEPPTVRNADVCTYTSGSSHFRFRVDAGVPPLRLRRTFIANLGVPGAIAGAPAAEIRVNGGLAGWFPPAVANPDRPWQQQEVLLDSGVSAGVLDIEIVPEFVAYAAGFSESAYELRGGWKDPIFAEGFDPVFPFATNLSCDTKAGSGPRADIKKARPACADRARPGVLALWLLLENRAGGQTRKIIRSGIRR
jgi:hypothetical protein